jgi:hypothetical protein
LLCIPCILLSVVARGARLRAPVRFILSRPSRHASRRDRPARENCSRLAARMSKFPRYRTSGESLHPSICALPRSFGRLHFMAFGESFMRVRTQIPLSTRCVLSCRKVAVTSPRDPRVRNLRQLSRVGPSRRLEIPRLASWTGGLPSRNGRRASLGRLARRAS